MRNHEPGRPLRIDARMKDAAGQFGAPMHALLTDRNYRFMLRVMSDGCDRCAQPGGCARALLDGEAGRQAPASCPDSRRLDFLRTLKPGG